MILPINIQVYYFLSTLLAGLIVGIFFDIYRIIRGFNTPNKIITAISDTLFWILAGFVTFIFFLYTNNGDLGYYTFVGLIAGLLIYFILISKGFIKVLGFIVYFILKFFRIIVILIIYPIKLIRYYTGYGIFKTKVLCGKVRGKIKDANIKSKQRKKKEKVKA